METQWAYREYKLLEELIGNNTGLRFQGSQKELLIRAINNRMKQTEHSSLFAYYKFLSKYDGLPESGELEKLINLITIGETYFFRNIPHFKAIEQYILPRFITNKRFHLNVWSAASSTGEEPYSLAMLLRENLPNFEKWKVNILATDINNEHLIKAQKGIYNPRAIHNVPTNYLNKYFNKTQDEFYALSSAIKSMVNLTYFNLNQREWPKLINANWDIIFCRNVLIYFEPYAQEKVLQKLSTVLNNKGFLLLGHSETIPVRSTELAPIYACNTFFYFKGKNKQSLVTHKQKRESTKTTIISNETKDTKFPQSITKFTKHKTEYKNSKIINEQPPQISSEKKISSKELYEKGLTYLEENKSEKALEYFTKIETGTPESAEARLYTALILVHKNKEIEALDLCKEALQENKLLPEVYYLIGLIMERLEKPKKARKEYQKVLFLDENFVIARFNLARLYQNEGNTEAAKREYRNALNTLNHLPKQFVLKFTGGYSRENLKQMCVEILQLFS